MKYLYLKISIISIFIASFSLSLTAQRGINPVIEKQVRTTDPVLISYNDLPPFVKEFMYKGYEVMPEDVETITKLKRGAFLVEMNKSVNVFAINTQLKMQDQKLEFFEVGIDMSMQRKLRTQKIKRNRVRRIRTPSQEPEIAWGAIPLNVREYLIKRLKADESQVYKAFDLGNDTYKVILKETQDKFVIFEDSPDRIAFEHSITDLLD